MNKFSLAISLALSALLFSCGSPSEKGMAGAAAVSPSAALITHPETPGMDDGERAAGSASAKKGAENEASSSTGKEFSPTNRSHRIQLTAINFLRGGFGACDVKNKIFHLSPADDRREIPICRNASVELSLVSHGGKVYFQALDLVSNEKLTTSDAKSGASLVLGSRGMHRTQFENPYGFSYVMAEDVSGIEPELLERWNAQSSLVATLKGKALTAIRQGQAVPSDVESALEVEEAALRKIAEEIHAADKT